MWSKLLTFEKLPVNVGKMSRGRPIATVAALVCAAGCSLVLDFSESEDGGPEDPRCEAFEPNESDAAASAIGPGRHELALCGEDIDFFRVTVAAGEDLVLSTSSDGELEIGLSLLEGGAVIDASDGTGPMEIIERSAAMGNQLAPGEYGIRVQGAVGAEGDYDLQVEISGGPAVDAGVDGA